MLSNGWKDEVLALINSENNLSLEQNDINLNFAKIVDGVSYADITPATDSVYFGERRVSYTKWDTEKFFLGVPLKLIVEADTTVKDVIEQIAAKYQLTIDEAIDFTEEELTKSVTFEEAGIRNIVVPAADTSCAWVGNFNITVSNSTLNLVNLIKVNVLDGLTYIDGITTAKVNVQGGVLTYPIDFTSISSSLSGLKVNDKLSTDIAQAILDKINYVPNTTTIAVADLADKGSVVFNGKIADTDYARDGFDSALIIDYGDADKVVGKLRIYYRVSSSTKPLDLHSLFNFNVNMTHGNTRYTTANDNAIKYGADAILNAAVFLADTEENKPVRDAGILSNTGYLARTDVEFTDEQYAKIEEILSAATITCATADNKPTITAVIADTEEYDGATLTVEYPVVPTGEIEVRPINAWTGSSINADNGLNNNVARIIFGCQYVRTNPNVTELQLNAIPAFIAKYCVGKDDDVVFRSDVATDAQGSVLKGGIEVYPDTIFVMSPDKATDVMAEFPSGALPNIDVDDYGSSRSISSPDDLSDPTGSQSIWRIATSYCWFRTPNTNIASADWRKRIAEGMSCGGASETWPSDSAVMALEKMAEEGALNVVIVNTETTETTITRSLHISNQYVEYDLVPKSPALALDATVALSTESSDRTITLSESLLTDGDVASLSYAGMLMTYSMFGGAYEDLPYVFNILFIDNVAYDDREFKDKAPGIVFDKNNVVKNEDGSYSNPTSDFPNIKIMFK